jgi:hypothetical protein
MYIVTKYFKQFRNNLIKLRKELKRMIVDFFKISILKSIVVVVVE